MLTPAQLTALAADIRADHSFDSQPHNSDGAFAIAAAYNMLTADFYCWQTAVSVSNIFDQITWANYTPADVPDGTVQWSNRSLACQGKQFNLEIMLQGRDTINAAKTNLRAGIQDATSQLPSGASGAIKSGGWGNIQPILSRLVTRLEKLFATGTGTVASPATMAVEGQVAYQDIVTAMGW